jgi:predicted RecB family nuclease
LPSDLLIPDNHPDLIAVLPEGSGRLFRLIDVKRGTSLQLAYRIQVYLYALLLQAMIQEHDIGNARVDLDQGAVWLGGAEQPELFNLSGLQPHVEQFLRHDLARILDQPPQEASWHLESRCEWCDYFRDCHRQMQQQDDLSRLSNLTRGGKQHLLQLGVRRIADLGSFLQREDADEQLAACASLHGERHYLENKVAALQTQQPVVHGATSLALPRGENVALFLTLQREPLAHSVYLAGMLVNLRADLQTAVFDAQTSPLLFGADRKAQPVVLVAEQPGKVDEVRREFVSLLFRVLLQVQAYNQTREWKDQLTLQTYTHTEREKQLLVAWLLETLDDVDLAEQADALPLPGP